MERNFSKKVGLPPGSVVYIGQQRGFTPSIRFLRYSADEFFEDILPIDQLQAQIDPNQICWLHITGVHDTDLIASIGDMLQLHPLFVEDIANTTQRPKADELEGALMVVLKSFRLEKEVPRLVSQQITLVLTHQVVLSFGEEPGEVLDHIRNRLLSGKGNLRKRSADYLLFAIIDVLVDSYYEVLEELIPLIESVETSLMQRNPQNLLHRIQRLSRALFTLRKNIYPLRESINKLCRGDYEQVKPANLKYYSDVNDHLLQMLDNIDFYIQLTNSLKELHMANISYKMNKVMQALTAISAVFIPLTFLVGVYGMNFKNMPELSWHYGYYILWLLMVGLGLGLFWGFKRKGWF